MSIIIFFVILLILVIVHEYGHFSTAKFFGIRVDEFGFGFPPKLFGIKKGETEYSFNLLPIGGFVKIFGENPDDENTSGPDADRSFVNKPKYQQAIVLFAGVFANFLLAWLLFSIGFMSGFPTSVGNEPKGYSVTNPQLVLVSVLAGSPAEGAGLESGDVILSIESEGEIVRDVNPEVLKSFIISHEGKPITIIYGRGENEKLNYARITPVKNSPEGLPTIGVAMDQIGTVKLPVFRAFLEGMRYNLLVTRGAAVGLYTLILEGIQGKGSFDSVVGPVGLVGIVGYAYESGFVSLITFAAFISINLAIINLVPFPALDGGRLFFLLIEKIKGSRINPKFVNTANMAGFALLILLMLVVTYKDVMKLF